MAGALLKNVHKSGTELKQLQDTGVCGKTGRAVWKRSRHPRFALSQPHWEKK